MIEVFPDIPKSLTPIPCVPPEDHLPMNIHVQSKLFDDTKAYLLVGGIGSLGIHIALWMCQVRSSFRYWDVAINIRIIFRKALEKLS